MGCTSSNHRIIKPALPPTERSRSKETRRRPGRSRLEESDEVGSDSSSGDDDDSSHKLERSKSAARIASQCAQSSVAAVRRMAAEAKHMQKHKIEGVSAYPASEGSMLQWVGFINGPEGTPYEGGSFTIDIDIPEDYPFKPPKMRFRTPIWHPNITGDGRGKICMDILKADHWSALLTLQTALLSLVSLLADPNTGDPLNVEASDELEHFPELFNAKAREWTLKYASCRGKVSRTTVARHEDDNAYLQCDHTGQVIDEDEALDAAIEHSLRKLPYMLTPISKEAQPARPPPSTDSFAMSRCTLTWEVLRDTRSLSKFDYILITEGYDVRHMVVFETCCGGRAIELHKYHVTEVPLAREFRSCRDDRTSYRVRLSSSAKHCPEGIDNAEFAAEKCSHTATISRVNAVRGLSEAALLGYWESLAESG
ncbi:ubiquitin-conjugating enzyme E2 K, partial [Perkinsus olseni]